MPPGAPEVTGHTGVVSDQSTVTTPPVGAPSYDVVIVFVSYVNGEIGGGSLQVIQDSASDYYFLLDSTGYALNHTEDLYATSVATTQAALTVSVTFSGGATAQGGSVAVAVVANVNLSSIDALAENTGTSGMASVSMTAKHNSDLVLFGVAGRLYSGPYSAGPGELVLNSGGGTAGPYTDGIAYGIYESSSSSLAVTPTAGLNLTTYWEAIGLALTPA